MSWFNDTKNAREILLKLGIGDFNATMVVPVMFYAPAQGDPDITPIKVLTKAIQKVMQQMGATWLSATGRIDNQTAECLQAIAGPLWNETVYFDLCKRLMAARDAGKRFSRPVTPASSGRPVELSGLGLLPSFPDVPGGLVTVGILGYLGYRYFTKR